MHPIATSGVFKTIDDGAFDSSYEDFPQPVWLVDPESSQILRVNRAMCMELGVPRMDLMQTTEAQFCAPEEVEHMVAQYAGPASPEWTRYSRQQRNVDGSYCNVQVQFTSINYKGRVVRLAVAHNLHQRRRDTVLRQQIEILKSLVGNAGYGLGRYCVTRKRLVFFNQHLLGLLGAPDGVVHDLPELTSQQSDYMEQVFTKAEDWAAFLEAAEARQPFQKIVLWKGQNGLRHHVRLQCVPTETPYGVEVDLSAEDATESVRLEQQFRQLQKMEALGRMAGGVAHDFNNLLLVIRGHAELLEESLPADSDLRRHTTKLIAASRQAADITSTLLTFSRSEESPLAPLALNKTIRAYSQLMPSFLRSGVMLDVDLPNEEFHILASAVHIEQVVLNLCVNARDAMPDGGRVTVRTKFVPAAQPGEKGSVMLEVSDTGVGMDAETRAHIFEPFYTTKARGKGTGLGLALVYGIITQYGGRIEVDTEIGRGTAFRLYFPLVARSQSETPAAPKSSTRGKTVLLVDDEPEIRNMVSDFLQMLGHKVLSAGHPVEALEASKAHDGKIDLLITDVVMPEMDGFELAIRLREERAGLPVLVMSGFTGGALAKRGRQLGDVPFLSKPFSLRQMEASLKAILGQAAENEELNQIPMANLA